MHHRQRGPASRARTIGLTVALVLVGLGTSSSGAKAQTAPAADQPASPGMLERLGIKARVPPAPDFVTSSRKAETGYIPVGRRGASRPMPVMNPAELASVTAGLDVEREHQQRRAGQTPAIVPVKVVTPKKPKARGH